MSLEHEELTGQIIGAAIEVHKTLGPDYVEAFYENVLALELRARSIPACARWERSTDSS